MSAKSRRRDRRTKRARGYGLAAAFGGPIGVGVKGLKDHINSKSAKRKAKKNEDLKYLGGSKEEEQRLYDEAKQGKLDASAREKETADTLEQTQAETAMLGRNAGREYTNSSALAGRSLGEQRAGIDSMGSAAAKAAMQLTEGTASGQILRNNALNSTTISPAAQAQIDAQARNAQAQLQANSGLMNRQLMGLAAGQGEGGALAMQQAVAQAGQGGYDALLQNQLQQNQLATDIRAQERANMLNTAAANAAQQENLGGQQAQLTYGAAQNQQQAQAQLAQQYQQQQQLSSQRQLGLVGQAGQLANANEEAALANQGQNMQYQSGLLTARFGAQQERQDRPTWKKIMFPLGMLGGK